MQTSWFYHKRLDKTLIQVSGKDHAPFLQNMLTQDFRAMKQGDLLPACFCTNRGKLIADTLVYKLSSEMLLEVDQFIAEPLIQKLSQFIISEDVQLEVTDKRVTTVFSWSPTLDKIDQGFQLQGTSRPFFQLVDRSAPSEAIEASFDQFEQFRISEGIPQFGRDITSDNFPPESDFLTKSISYNKGCYIGQETIARLHSRGGNVARKLMGVETSAQALDVLNQKILFESNNVGVITSAVKLATGKTLALAMVHRTAFLPETMIQVETSAGLCPGRVLLLPHPQN